MLTQGREIKADTMVFEGAEKDRMVSVADRDKAGATKKAATKKATTARKAARV